MIAGWVTNVRTTAGTANDHQSTMVSSMFCFEPSLLLQIFISFTNDISWSMLVTGDVVLEDET